jgi:hypothetical protein
LYIARICHGNSSYVNGTSILLINFFHFQGCEQCSMMSGQLKVGTYYYLKDLKRVYFACQGLSYGKKDQTLLIDDEPNKAL